MNIKQLIASLGLVLAAACSGQANESTSAEAYYIANEGVMVTQGKSKIVFDPLFQQSFGQYQRPSKEAFQAIIDGTPPFDLIDAVFISHYHGDHFSPADMLVMMQKQPKLKLVAPKQAVAALRNEAGYSSKLDKRITVIELEYQDPPKIFRLGKLDIAAVRIPHSGWPQGRLDVENITFRVTLNDDVTVLHMGDADVRDLHYAHDAKHWANTQINMAFPPYWYYQTKDGRYVLDERLQPYATVGVHVPMQMPKDPIMRPIQFMGRDLFVTPGETREIPRAVQE